MPRKDLPNYSKYIRKTKEERRVAQEKRQGFITPVKLKCNTPVYSLIDYYYECHSDRLRELYAVNECIIDYIRRKLIGAYEQEFGKQCIVTTNFHTNWVKGETSWKAEVMAIGVHENKKWLQEKFQELCSEIVKTYKTTSRWRRPSEAEDEIKYDPKKEI